MEDEKIMFCYLCNDKTSTYKASYYKASYGLRESTTAFFCSSCDFLSTEDPRVLVDYLAAKVWELMNTRVPEATYEDLRRDFVALEKKSETMRSVIKDCLFVPASSILLADLESEE
tara:strand:- start:59 stop:406 length:348 start_codon:yes stop_codon:yes gene_type:complete